MSDDDEHWRYRQPENRADVIARAMSRLTFGATATGQEQVDPINTSSKAQKPLQERLEAMFSDFVYIDGAPMPLTQTLARRLGYHVE